MKTDPSHFFNGIEQVLHSDSANKSLQALENSVRNDGASEELIDSIVNGALRDFIYGCLPKKEDIQVIGPDGEVNNDPRQEKTFDQWIDTLTNIIQGIDRNRIKAIMMYMCQKGYIVEDKTNNFISGRVAPVKRQLLNL